MPRTTLWAAYVGHITAGDSQGEISRRTGVPQGTLSRYLTGAATPDKAAMAATVARAYGRNPIEAFVAAGFITEDEAGSSLGEESRSLLADLRAVA